MNEGKERISINQFQNIIGILSPSMDDFLYIYDLQNDIYCISPSAVERFNIEKHQMVKTSDEFTKLVYPADIEMLMQELRQAVTGETAFHNLQYRWLDKDGNAVWINCRGRVTKDENGRPEYLIGCINEIGKQQAADNSSGLLREVALRQEFDRHIGAPLSGFLMRLGIDNFREINENKGVDYGDMILRETVECIQTVLTPHQKLYRIVGDEFAVVDFTGKTAQHAHTLYHAIRKEIDRFIEENEYEVFYTLSAGILELDAFENQEYENLSMLSEFTLAEAKNRGKNQSYIYQGEDYNKFLRRKTLIRAMRQAINRNYEGFEAYFQPIVNIGEKQLAMAETLLRFRSEETGAVSPVEFIPLLEESGLIIPVGRWVLHKAMEACKCIQKSIPSFCVSVNVSYVQILKSNILADIREGLEKYDLESTSVAIELTESGFLEVDEILKTFCEGLQESGIRMALDDFGTGYSNFRYLYNISPDTIKIDRSFTIKALQNEYDYGLLQHMVDMAHGLKLKLCIEGVETEDELRKISEMGPDYIQGYFFGRPCAFDTFVSQHIK